MARDSPDLTRIVKAREDQDDDAEKLRLKALVFGAVRAVLIPLAILILAVQVPLLRQGGPVAFVAMWLEVAALICLLLSRFLNLRPDWHEKWVDAFVRVALLRREERLFVARVGPYQTGNVQLTVETRLEEIKRSGSEALIRKFASEADEQLWRDELERSTDAAKPKPLEHFQDYYHGVIDEHARFGKEATRSRDRDKILACFIHERART